MSRSSVFVARYVLMNPTDGEGGTKGFGTVVSNYAAVKCSSNDVDGLFEVETI